INRGALVQSRWASHGQCARDVHVTADGGAALDICIALDAQAIYRTCARVQRPDLGVASDAEVAADACALGDGQRALELRIFVDRERAELAGTGCGQRIDRGVAGDAQVADDASAAAYAQATAQRRWATADHDATDVVDQQRLITRNRNPVGRPDRTRGGHYAAQGQHAGDFEGVELLDVRNVAGGARRPYWATPAGPPPGALRALWGPRGGGRPGGVQDRAGRQDGG